MSKFKLKEDTVEVRGVDVRVRELTQKERTKWLETATVDRFITPAMLMSMCSLDPTWTLEEAREEPADVAEIIVDKIMELSNISTKKDQKGKQSNAGGALPVQSESGAKDIAE